MEVTGVVDPQCTATCPLCNRPIDGTDGVDNRLDVQQPKRKRVSHECVVPMNINCHQKTMLPVRNQTMLRRYYEKAFESLQQINCRILAKAYVKLVEPRKQVNFPYNGRKIIAGSSQQFDPELNKPAWWPSGVTHREPDHLLKAGGCHLQAGEGH